MRGLHRTDIEIIMANALEKNNITFVEQYPIRCKYGYIADFYLPDFKIIIECDGEQFHNKKRDNKRDAILRKLEYKIIRFSGTEIRTDINTCLNKIKHELNSSDVLSCLVL